MGQRVWLIFLMCDMIHDNIHCGGGGVGGRTPGEQLAGGYATENRLPKLAGARKNQIEQTGGSH